MSSKVRKQIYIEPRQEHLLKAMSDDKPLRVYAQQAGISEAEVIRSCIDLHLSGITAPQIDIAAWEAEKEFIEKIKTRPVKLGGRDWKREDLYER